MKTRNTLMGLLGVGVLMGTGTGVAMAQTFSYTTTFTPNPIPGSPLGNFITVTNGTNSSIDGSGIGSAINLSNFVETSNVPPPTTVNFTQAFNIALTINPNGTLITQTKDFSGTISGQYNTKQSLTATLFNMPLSQTFDFGSLGSYTVNDLAFQQPGPQGSSTVGSIGGFVHYNAPPSTVPEPATLAPFALGGLGLLGLIVRKTRRTNGAAA